MASTPMHDPEAAETPGATHATGALPARPSDKSEDIAVILAPSKERRVWPVRKVGAPVNTMGVSAVTAPGAHLAQWGLGDKLSRPRSYLARPDSVEHAATTNTGLSDTRDCGDVGWYPKSSTVSKKSRSRPLLELMYR